MQQLLDCDAVDLVSETVVDPSSGDKWSMCELCFADKDVAGISLRQAAELGLLDVKNGLIKHPEMFKSFAFIPSVTEMKDYIFGNCFQSLFSG